MRTAADQFDIMALQVLWGSGRPFFCQTGVRGADDTADVGDLHRHQARGRQIADAYRDVDAFLDQVHDPIHRHQIGADIRIEIKEIREQRRDVDAAEFDRGGDPQQTRRPGGSPQGQIVDGLQFGKNAAHLLNIGLADIRLSHNPRGPGEQPRAKAFFQLVDAACDRGGAAACHAARTA